MRTPPMSRLAALPADLRARITVHPVPLDETGLFEVADVAVCRNTIACLRSSSLPPVRRSVPVVAVVGGL
ncbi:hypothetical protein ACIP2X_14530 [Streptomyces sp. NPDC089424]|uniref:hypothetical protein n=1 Tax=Streptomyces sp. NPDC089424 TaxID=3365917 RepID=UPI00382DBCA8